MQHYTVVQWFLLFYIYCFFGWCFESTVVSVSQKRLVNRGFCYGPVIPIYGFGAVVILFATLPVKNSPVLIFVFGMLAATALEYLVGLQCEVIFKVRYWDYSKRPFNVKGYICLRSSLCWGALSVFLMRFLHAKMEKLVLAVPTQWASGLALACTAVFMYDVACSVRTALDLRRLLVQLEQYTQKAKEEARVLQRRFEILSTVRREDLAKRIESWETLSRWAEALEQLTKNLESDEKVRQLREDLSAWKARRMANRESIRQRMTQDKIQLLRRNPSTVSHRYGQQLQRLVRSIQDRKHMDETQKP